MGALDAHTPYAELERQHKLLHARLAALRKGASAEPAADGTALLQQVEKVRSSLALHFNFEESVGTLSYLFGAFPALQPEIERLRAEHARFLATLDRVAVGLRNGSGAPNVRGTLLHVLDELAEHELNERQLGRSAALGSGPMRMNRPEH